MAYTCYDPETHRLLHQNALSLVFKATLDLIFFEEMLNLLFYLMVNYKGTIAFTDLVKYPHFNRRLRLFIVTVVEQFAHGVFQYFLQFLVRHQRSEGAMRRAGFLARERQLAR